MNKSQCKLLVEESGAEGGGGGGGGGLQVFQIVLKLYGYVRCDGYYCGDIMSEC